MKKLAILLTLINFLFANTNYMYKDLDYLNLSEIQKKQVKEILLSQRKAFSKYYKAKAKAKEELQELMQNENFDEDEYEDTLEDIYEEAVELETDIFKKLHRVLTKEQRKKFSQRLEEWRVE